jgi:hypothetical protein
LLCFGALACRQLSSLDGVVMSWGIQLAC